MNMSKLHEVTIANWVDELWVTSCAKATVSSISKSRNYEPGKAQSNTRAKQTHYSQIHIGFGLRALKKNDSTSPVIFFYSLNLIPSFS
jgi:hypothetical protein